MSNQDLLLKLKTSWTKYDAVQVIDIIGNDELDDYLQQNKSIDSPILKAYLGINEFTDPIPNYWEEVTKNYPHLRKMYTLLAGIFTHYQNIKDFANTYSTINMGGVFLIGDGGKHQTNLRSALVEGGAALNSYRRKAEVPYEFTKIFAQEDIGLLFKKLLIDRLLKIGHRHDEIEKSFYEITYSYDFHKSLSLNKQQFKNWLEGKAVSQIKTFNYDINEFKEFYLKNKCFKVNQWLNEWDNVNYESLLRKKPDGFFYMFKMDIRLLKRISDVHRSVCLQTNLDKRVKILRDAF